MTVPGQRPREETGSVSDWDSHLPADTPGGAAVVEVRTSATAALIPTIRAVASDLAARADFDLDAISDLRMAVDEACATLVDVAAPATMLQCTFRVHAEHIEVHAHVRGGSADAAVSTDTFGWRVLQTLADHVEAFRQDNADGADPAGPTVGIRLDKHAGAPPR
jgi:serine/threonine-protein kinase RsbW